MEAEGHWTQAWADWCCWVKNIYNYISATQMRSSPLFAPLLLAIITLSAAVSIERGSVNIEVKTGDSSDRFKVDLSSSLKQTLNLTQSSQLVLQAKIAFTQDPFLPEFVSFRLRHVAFEEVSEPVLAVWDNEDETFEAVLDLGDPKHIKHLSGEYRLEVIISDDRLNKQLRKFIATAQVNFRYSLTAPQPSQLHYQQPSIIMTEPPATRVDPPAIFTIFVTGVIVLLFAVFLYGLIYQRANLSLFPGDGVGLLVNVVFLGSLGVVVVMLFKFWISWTFIETFQYFVVAILPLALAANYAFVHVKKQ